MYHFVFEILCSKILNLQVEKSDLMKIRDLYIFFPTYYRFECSTVVVKLLSDLGKQYGNTTKKFSKAIKY